MIPRGQARVLGRYLMCFPFAAGGMATVHLGRLLGPQGFSRTVAIKQLHAQLAQDTEFVTMFLDEARLTSRIRHTNVVAPLDVIECEGEICIVMEYVHGESLGRLMQASEHERIPLRIVTAIMVQTLLGLHAAHEATDDDGHPLVIVHRDVSPHNILVGEDGVTRVVDFGIAKAARRVHSTQGAKLKGKLGYMSPEQLRLLPVDRGCDLFSAGIILWEMLTGKPLFNAEEPAAAVAQMLEFAPVAPSKYVDLPPGFDAIALKALAVDREQRYATAREMARALEDVCVPAGALEVSEWVARLAGKHLARRAEWISDVECMSLAELTQSRPVERPRTTTEVLPADAPQVGAEPSKPEPILVEESPRAISQTQSLVVTSSRSPPPTGSSRTSWFRPLLLAGLALLGATAAVGLVLRTSAPIRTVGASLAAPAPIHSHGAGSPLTDAPSAPFGGAPPLQSEPTVLEQPEPAVAPAGTEAAAQFAPRSDASSKHPSSSAGVLPAKSNGDRKARASTSAKSAPADCTTPYTIDAQGIKRFRPECFVYKH